MSRNPFSSMTQIDLFAELEANIADGVLRPGRVENIGRRPARPRLVPAPQLSDEEMASRLEATGRYRILRQLQPRPIRDAGTFDSATAMPSVPAARDGERIGLILDTETTGLDHGSHEIIELGMVAFTYDEGGIRDVVGTFSALREPGVPISAEMVASQSIDLEAVARFAEPADLVIAHNARFDRPFVERFAPGFDAKPWACSFHTKDILKARGYRWSDGTDGRPKCWWREIEEDAHDEEAAFLEAEIYGGESPALVVRLTACDRFKA